MIEEHSIEQLKSRIDIIEVISSYIELKKHGSIYKALCPFHTEKTPSFVVSPSKNIFKCFGCGKAGDAVSFVMEIEHIGYVEAIEKLALMYNFQLSYTNKEPKKPTKILETINEFFKKRLLIQKDALLYLKQRGINDASIEKFELGFAPSIKESLEFINSKHFLHQELINSGIVGIDNGKIYPRFIDRITFPIYAPNNKLVGFGARTISNHPAKYINSPETELFKKSKLLYGYHLAKDAIFKKKEIIIVEGYLDVIMLHQAGFNNVTATLGTALTRDHLPLLKKGEPKIIVAFDGDSAGIEAAFKVSNLLINNNILDGGVIIFNDGLDPADMIAQNRSDEVAKLLLKPTPFVAFCIQKICYSYDLKIPEQKNRALKEATNFLSTLPQVLQDEYKEYLASILKIDKKNIRTKRVKNIETLKDEIDPTNKERRIIKSILEKPTLLDMVLDFIDIECFFEYKDEFSLLKNGNFLDEKLQKILIDDNTKPFNEKELKDELKVLIIKAYQKEIELLKKANIDLETKTFWIHNRFQKISELKKGVLASYESCGIV